MAGGMWINRKWYSYASAEIALLVEGTPALVIAEIPEIAYKDGTESEDAGGTGKYTIGTTDPIYKAGDTTWSMYKQSANRLIERLEAAAIKLLGAGAGAADVGGSIKVTYRIPGQALSIDEIVLASFGKSVEDGGSRGPAGIMTKFAGQTSGILRNGKKL